MVLGEPAVPQKGSLAVEPSTAPAAARPAAANDAVTVAPSARFGAAVVAELMSVPAFANTSTTRASSANRTADEVDRSLVRSVTTVAVPSSTSTSPVAGSYSTCARSETVNASSPSR